MSAAAPRSPVVNTGALERLFAPWEEPDKHRVRAGKGAPPEVRALRRPSPIPLANRLRPSVREWREANYYGASDTTRELFGHWFDRPHRAARPDGGEGEFRYYFCQREAIETLVFLMEARGLRALSSLVAEYGGGADEALGVKPEDDEWARYAFKLATGAGKTKCMSLAIVWSYFHALRESGSGMARNFVVIAPNLTVFERLREDFRPEGGGPDIFTKDPLVPPEWRGDWNLRTVLQDEAGGAGSGGTLYLTNIHRLFALRRAGRKDAATRAWAGPPPARAAALDRGAELRDRITAHGRAMILNDEAHHVWDPGSAWSEAIRWLHETLRKRGGDGLAAQLDFSATPKDNRGRVFPHVVCDSPLGEAVDAGIVKTPVIGRAGDLVEQPHEDAAYRYEAHLRLGYERWRRSREEWAGSGRMPLLFVMCEDTGAADSIAKRLDADPLFRDLNGRTINLHTNLKGKIKRRKIGGTTVEIFEENEKAISDEDMKAIRRISRELDSDESPYFCIVSVLMLREGWDVRNVTTIVPLRSYSSKANILPEQTLGRGLRRMTPPGQANELVAVVEHPAFTSLYRQELEQGGLLIDERDADDIDASTVSIFPDKRKDLEALDIALPVLTAANRIRPTLENLPADAVRERFRAFSPLPLGDKGAAEVDYEGRHLITDEVVERMEVSLPLLRDGFTAISFFARELEAACKVQGAHKVLAPSLQTFLGEILFGEKVGLADPRLAARLADQDVREHVRAVFVPLIRERTVEANIPRVRGAPVSVRGWKPYQATRSDRRPAAQAGKTLFNLVPCDNALEVRDDGVSRQRARRRRVRQERRTAGVADRLSDRRPAAGVLHPRFPRAGERRRLRAGGDQRAERRRRSAQGGRRRRVVQICVDGGRQVALRIRPARRDEGSDRPPLRGPRARLRPGASQPAERDRGRAGTAVLRAESGGRRGILLHAGDFRQVAGARPEGGARGAGALPLLRAQGGLPEFRAGFQRASGSHGGRVEGFHPDVPGRQGPGGPPRTGRLVRTLHAGGERARRSALQEHGSQSEARPRLRQSAFGNRPAPVVPRFRVERQQQAGRRIRRGPGLASRVGSA